MKSGQELIGEEVSVKFEFHKPYRKFTSKAKVISVSNHPLKKKNGKKYEVEFKNGKTAFVHFQKIKLENDQ